MNAYARVFQGTLPDLGFFVRSGTEANVIRCFKWEIEYNKNKRVSLQRDDDIIKVEYEPYDPKEFCIDPEGKKGKNRFYIPDLRITYRNERTRPGEIKGRFKGTDGPPKMKGFRDHFPELFKDMLFIGTKPAVNYFKTKVAIAVDVECWLTAKMQSQYKNFGLDQTVPKDQRHLYEGYPLWQTAAQLKAMVRTFDKSGYEPLPFGEEQ